MGFIVTDSLTFTGTGASTSVHLNNVANGSASIVAIATNQSATNRITSVTDTKSNTYTQAGSYAGTNIEIELWYSLNATLDNTTQVTVTPVGTYVWSSVWAVTSGIGTTSAFDRTAGAAGVAGTTGDSGVAATSQVNNEILFGVGGQANNRPFNAGTGYTSINQISNGTSAEIFLEYKIVSSTGNYNATGTWDIASNWAMGLFGFADSAVGAVSKPHLLGMMGVGI